VAGERAVRGAFLEELTWPEAGARLRAGVPVVIPIGAAAKEHGPHLPLNTDYLVARELGRRVALALPVLVAPVVAFGYYPAFAGYPGSQHLRAETFVAVLTDLFEGLVRQGAARLAVVNTGVSTEAPLRVAVRDFYAARGVRVATADIRGLGRATRPLLGQRLGGHADEEETSLLLAIRPGAVRLERARPDYGHALDQPDTVFYRPTVFSGDPGAGPDWSETGARGDPTLATAAKGEAILAEMARELVEGLRALYPEVLAAGPGGAGPGAG
jgi:creatinine amidohydrolase